jgi:hypothetical protein
LQKNQSQNLKRKLKHKSELILFKIVPIFD